MAIGDGKMEWAMAEAKRIFGEMGEIEVRSNGKCVVGYRRGSNGNIIVMGKADDWAGAVSLAEEAVNKAKRENK